jgi:hypothetical protein
MLGRAFLTVKHFRPSVAGQFPVIDFSGTTLENGSQRQVNRVIARNNLAEWKRFIFCAGRMFPIRSIYTLLRFYIHKLLQDSVAIFLSV